VGIQRGKRISVHQSSQNGTGSPRKKKPRLHFFIIITIENPLEEARKHLLNYYAREWESEGGSLGGRRGKKLIFRKGMKSPAYRERNETNQLSCRKERICRGGR